MIAESLVVARALGNPQRIADALETFGQVAIPEDATEARSYLSESLALYAEVGDQTGVASVENFLGLLDLRLRSYDSAIEHFRASLRLTRHWLYWERMTQSLDGIAGVAAGLGQPARALRLASASARIRAERVSRFSPREIAELETVLASARETLGETAAAAAWAAGEAMTVEQAVADALETDPDG
jgi:hypothetical protein